MPRALVLFAVLLTAPYLCPAAPPEGHVLAFEDTFDGKSLDATRWTAQKRKRRDAMNSPRAVTVEDGHLVLRTFTENGTHLTGFVGSQGKFEQAFGYWEARVRFFTTPGMWSAFWIHSPTMGNPIGDVKRAGSEIDVMEHRLVDQKGRSIPNLVPTTVHWDGYGKAHKSRSHKTTWKGPKPLQGNWHTYAVLWTPEAYVFFVDGKKVWRLAEGLSHRPQFIYLTSEVKDKGWAGPIPEGGYGSLETTTTRMEIDWVRVWKPAPPASRN